MKFFKKKKILLLRTGFTLLLLVLALLVYFQIFIAPKLNNEAGRLPTLVEQMVHKHAGTYVSLKDVSPFVNEAAVASQDEGFYSNSGVDLLGTARAIFFSLVSGQRQGASTITEQLAKNVYYNDVDNLKTDLLTKGLAIAISGKYPKDTVLEYYLNVIYFGRNAYGIGQASETYFGVVPKKLTIGQAAFLVGLVNYPSYLGTHLQSALDQAHLVLESMAADHAISNNQEEDSFASLEAYFQAK